MFVWFWKSSIFILLNNFLFLFFYTGWHRMGQTFSEPVTEKESTTEKNEVFLVSSSSIQGWRISKYYVNHLTLADN